VEGEGFLFGRDGREATQLGPLVAASAATAQSLFKTALAQAWGPLYLDIADHAVLPPEGLAEQRSFTRMVHGAANVPGERTKVFLVAGPELG